MERTAAEPSVSSSSSSSSFVRPRGASPTESLCGRSFQLQRAVATGRPASLSRGSSLASPGQTDERRVRGPRSCRRLAAARLLLLSAVPTRVGRSPSPVILPRARCGAFEPTDRAGHSPPACCCARRKVKETLRALLLVYPALYPFWCGGAPTPFL